MANDKVFRVADMYHFVIWNKKRTLKAIKVYPDYDQIVFISPKSINKNLSWKRGIQYFDYKVLAQILLEIEKDLLD